MSAIKQIETNILRLLNVESGEENKVKLLLLQSFFIGVFYGVFDITAQSVFLDVFDSDMTSIAIFVSGVLGLAITSLYSRLLRVLKFSTLLVLNFSFIFVILILIRLGYYISDSKWLSFIVFIMLGPLNLIAIVGFWGMTGRLFTLRQGKRLFGMIDSGQIFGIIISSFAITSFVLKLLDNVTIDLMYLAAFSIFVALIIQLIISRKFNINTEEVSSKAKPEEKKEKNFLSLFKNRYVSLMSAFIVFSMVVAFFIFFSFLDVTRSRYPDPVEKTNFISLFTAIGMIFSFLFKTFVYSRFINTYGLKAGLLLMPIVLGAFALISAGVGSLLGYSIESSGFMIFFLIIVLSRLMSVSLKSSMEVPTFKVLYQSLDAKIRHRVQAGIDGVVNEFAALFAGFILLLLGLLDFFEIIHYSYFLVVLIVMWVYFTFRLHKEYRKTLEKTLHSTKLKKTDEHIGNQEVGEFVNGNSHLEILELISPLKYEEYLIENLPLHCTLDNLKKIDSQNIFIARGKLQELLAIEKDEAIAAEIRRILDRFEKLENNSVDEKLIKKLIISIDEKERIKAANLIRINGNPKFGTNLAVLLRDTVPLVKIAAIRAVSRVKNNELCPVLIELLEKPRYYTYAAEALKSIGESALESLEQGFYKTGQENQVLVIIIKIMGEIGGQKSKKLLLSKIGLNNRDVLIETMESLKRMGFLAKNESELRQLSGILKLVISISAWNLNVKTQLNKNESTIHLQEAIDEEIRSNYVLLFLILSLMYDPNSIEQIKSNIETGSSETISFAIELLEILLDEEIKPLLFPLLEDITDNERVRRLQSHFNLSKYNPVSVLNAIVNRDSNYISNWVKVCAIESYTLIEEIKANHSIKAHVFNSNNILKQASASLLKQLDEGAFESCIRRLDYKAERQLRFVINKILNNNMEKPYEKMVFLKNIKTFKKFSNEMLLEMASYMEALNAPQNTIIYPTPKSKQAPLYLVVEGELQLLEEDQNVLEVINGEVMFKCLFSKSNHIKIQATKESMIYMIDASNLTYLMSKSEQLLNTIINNIK